MYIASRQLRVRHQLAGRDLAKMIRGVAAGRLGIKALEYVEKEWGMTAVELTRAAAVLEVEAVSCEREDQNE
jgi:hypothetical protein